MAGHCTWQCGQQDACVWGAAGTRPLMTVTKDTACRRFRLGCVLCVVVGSVSWEAVHAWHIFILILVAFCRPRFRRGATCSCLLQVVLVCIRAGLVTVLGCCRAWWKVWCKVWCFPPCFVCFADGWWTISPCVPARIHVIVSSERCYVAVTLWFLAFSCQFVAECNSGPQHHQTRCSHTSVNVSIKGCAVPLHICHQSFRYPW